VYLLKIDAEGFDGWVVKGTEELLKQKRVKYLVFGEWLLSESI
jgi:hypothetical protein